MDCSLDVDFCILPRPCGGKEEERGTEEEGDKKHCGEGGPVIVSQVLGCLVRKMVEHP